MMDPILRDVRARKPRQTGDGFSTSYGLVRSEEDAEGAAACAESFLEDLARMDLGHEGEHAVAEALRNVRAVLRFWRRQARKKR